MFEDDQLYFVANPKLRSLVCESTLAGWRSQGVGPPYFKVGRRVAYRGSDLNLWLSGRRIVPADSARERRAEANGG